MLSRQTVYVLKPLQLGIHPLESSSTTWMMGMEGSHTGIGHIGPKTSVKLLRPVTPSARF